MILFQKKREILDEESAAEADKLLQEIKEYKESQALSNNKRIFGLQKKIVKKISQKYCKIICKKVCKNILNF